jgi:hypothetical protein
MSTIISTKSLSGLSNDSNTKNSQDVARASQLPRTLCRTLQNVSVKFLLSNTSIPQPTKFLPFRTVAATIMSIMYGHDVSSSTEDSYVKRVEQSVGTLSDALLPGAAIVNAIPALRYLPSWFPGVDFKPLALGVKELTRQLQDAPIDFVNKGIVRFYH